MVLNLFKH